VCSHYVCARALVCACVCAYDDVRVHSCYVLPLKVWNGDYDANEEYALSAENEAKAQQLAINPLLDGDHRFLRYTQMCVASFPVTEAGKADTNGLNLAAIAEMMQAKKFLDRLTCLQLEQDVTGSPARKCSYCSDAGSVVRGCKTCTALHQRPFYLCITCATVHTSQHVHKDCELAPLPSLISSGAGSIAD
jgi:hypothetical protein